MCPYCVVKKHKATRHCLICRRCVRQYDHHCKWINNCIGRNNTRFFIFMNIWVFLECFACEGVGIWHLITNKREVDAKLSLLILFMIINFVMSVVISPVCFVTVRNSLKRRPRSIRIKRLIIPRGINKDFLSDTESMLIYQQSDTTSYRNSGSLAGSMISL